MPAKIGRLVIDLLSALKSDINNQGIQSTQ